MQHPYGLQHGTILHGVSLKHVSHLMQADVHIPLATCLPMLASALPTTVTSAHNHHAQTPAGTPTPALSHSDSTPEDQSIGSQLSSQATTATHAWGRSVLCNGISNRISKMFSCVTACIHSDNRPRETRASASSQPVDHATLANHLRNRSQSPVSPNPQRQTNAPDSRQNGAPPRLGAVNGRASASATAAVTSAAGGSNTTHSLRSKQSAMLQYARRGDMVNMRILHELYPDAFHQLRDENGNTLLHLTAASDNVYAAVYCLLNLQSDLESRNHAGRTPLLEAAACGRDKSVEMLVDWGANMLAHDANRQSVFTLATVHCKPETYELLERRLGKLM